MRKEGYKDIWSVNRPPMLILIDIDLLKGAEGRVPESSPPFCNQNVQSTNAKKKKRHIRTIYNRLLAIVKRVYTVQWKFNPP